MNEKTCDLTLPGSIPGLLRRCSPVIHVSDRWGGIVYDSSGTGVEPVHLGGSSWGMGRGAGRRVERSHVALDLSDATGRAHAAWWYRARIGQQKFATVLEIPLLEDWKRDDTMLSDLDLDDPRALPDGSRWVDAEALRRVCLHVAEMETTR